MITRRTNFFQCWRERLPVRIHLQTQRTLAALFRHPRGTSSDFPQQVVRATASPSGPNIATLAPEAVQVVRRFSLTREPSHMRGLPHGRYTEYMLLGLQSDQTTRPAEDDAPSPMVTPGIMSNSGRVLTARTYVPDEEKRVRVGRCANGPHRSEVHLQRHSCHRRALLDNRRDDRTLTRIRTRPKQFWAG